MRRAYVVLAFGSRGWKDRDAILATLYEIEDAVQNAGGYKLIHGGAKGADLLAAECAKELDWKIDVVLPEYERWGRYAAPKKRNEKMAQRKPDLAVGFWDGISGGSKHMLKLCLDNHIHTHVRFPK